MPERADEWDAELIRGLRSRLGMTQQELANELGVRQQTVSEWETGMYRPRGASVRMLRHVAERAESYDAKQQSGWRAGASQQDVRAAEHEPPP